ncbi:MAG: helix-turn-helix transcriptional regulator [Verrucomicrobia bacterium]|nr:helix-turn-helix transcriptional regulator [Verrucomicrobiota bacterium]
MNQLENSDTPQSFGARLRWFRSQRNLTQADLGKAVARTATSISEWEKGESEPSLDQIAKLATALEVARERLAFGVEVNDLDPAETLARDIREQIEALLRDSGSDLSRLGWLLEELRRLRPSHWIDHDEINRRAEEMSLQMTADHERRKKEAIDQMQREGRRGRAGGAPA